MIWCLISIFCRLVHWWSYASAIETAVLFVILYDVIWHRLNAIREIKRDEEAEVKTIQREQASEKRQIRRERQETIRKHWQELQSNLISLHRVTSQLTQQRQFIQENSKSQDPTTMRALTMTIDSLPETLSDFNERWARVVAQLNVFPEPRDLLALNVLQIVQELGKSINDRKTGVTDETLKALANLIKRVADEGRLLDLDD
jgi:hypothetical protein